MKSVATKNGAHRIHGDSPGSSYVSETPQRFTGRRVLSVFSTPLGWFGLVGHEGVLTSVIAGHASAKMVKDFALKAGPLDEERDWSPEIRGLFEAYVEGEIVDFSDVPIELPPMTPFRSQVLHATRKVGYGETASYGELARRVGHPGAARAVGTVMSTNRFPILIPCHRILAAGGKLGGYSSPSGTCLKIQLLELEARSAGKLEVLSLLSGPPQLHKGNRR